MTNTTRERFDDACQRILEIYQLDDSEIDKIFAFIETIEKEAEERGIQMGREDCKQEVKNLIDNTDDFQLFIWNFENMDKEKEKKQKFISSLK